MAKTLLETIQKTLEQPAQSVGGIQDETQTVQKLLRGKTGKSVGPQSGPKQSALQERLAAATAKTGSDQLQQQGQLAGLQLGEQQADIAQRTQQQGQQFEAQRKDLFAAGQRQADAILDQLERGTKTLEAEKQSAAMEQLGFNIRLGSEQYVTQLQQAGKQARLDNDLAFKEALYRDAFEDNLDIVNNDIAFNTVMKADDRQFAEELSQMDINYAMEIASNQQKAASTQQTFSGISGVISGTTGIFNAMQKQEDRDLSIKTAEDNSALKQQNQELISQLAKG